MADQSSLDQVAVYAQRINACNPTHANVVTKAKGLIKMQLPALSPVVA